jgi:hypothetical protein
MPHERIALKDDADVVAAWKAAVRLSRRVGFNAFKQACLSGAVLELCRQAVERGGGACELGDSSDKTSFRARVVVDGCAPGRVTKEIHVGPSLPAVKLHQVTESLHAEPSASGARVSLTIQQSRAPRPASARHAGTAWTTR